ncbi:hypothetical protein Tco_1455351 [Tanacetum coccineum]
MKFHLKSLTARIKEQVKDQLPQILPKEVSNFALSVIESLIKESRDEVTLAKVSSQPHSTYEAASTLTEFELKKILLDKIEKSESYLAAPEHRDCYDSLKKSYDLDKDFFFSYDVYSLKRSRKDKDEDPSAGSYRGLKNKKLSKDAEPTAKEPVFEVADSDMPQDQEGNLGDNEDEPRNETASRRDWFKKPTPPQEPTDPDWYALLEKLDWENPEGGDYPFDLSKPLPLITRGKRQRVPFEYFINNDLKYLQGGVSTMTYTTSTTKTKAAYPSMHKQEAGNQEEMYILQNVLWLSLMSRFKEGDFLRLWINDIKDMLLLMVQNPLTNLSGDDVADFAIALTMFNRSLVIQKRVKDLQLGVENPQGFIYVDEFKRNRLMRSDELYKFSDGTLTRLLSSLKDITKNIDMEYLPKRRWSTLEKFVGGRLYGTDLRLLQRTI